MKTEHSKHTFLRAPSSWVCLHTPSLASPIGAGAGTGAYAFLSAFSTDGTSRTSTPSGTLLTGPMISLLSLADNHGALGPSGSPTLPGWRPLTLTLVLVISVELLRLVSLRFDRSPERSRSVASLAVALNSASPGRPVLLSAQLFWQATLRPSQSSALLLLKVYSRKKRIPETQRQQSPDCCPGSRHLRSIH